LCDLHLAPQAWDRGRLRRCICTHDGARDEDAGIPWNREWRNTEGFGITVSYWESEEAIKNWRTHAEHLIVQKKGRENFYEWYESRVGRIERAVSFKSAK